MKVLYLLNQRLPTEKAYGIQVAKMCEAFAGEGVEVVLAFPTRNNPYMKGNLYSYYSVKNNFRTKIILSPDFYFPAQLDRVSFYAKNFISAIFLSSYALSVKTDFIYSRDELLIFMLSFFKKNLLFEAHKFSSKRSFYYRRFKRAGVKVVAITESLRIEFLKLGFQGNKIIVAPDAVDLKDFNIPISKEEARAKLNLPQTGSIAMYIGHLFEWKGADTLVRAAPLLESDIHVVIGGGAKHDVARIKKLDPQNRVRFEGLTPFALLPTYLSAADVLVLPNKKDGGISEFHTSPLKLFAYMASQRPIIASDVSSTREILDDQSAFFFEPDNAQSLAETITRALVDKEKCLLVAQNAFGKVQHYTWKKRAQNILDFLNR